MCLRVHCTLFFEVIKLAREVSSSGQVFCHDSCSHGNALLSSKSLISCNKASIKITQRDRKDRSLVEQEKRMLSLCVFLYMCYCHIQDTCIQAHFVGSLYNHSAYFS